MEIEANTILSIQEIERWKANNKEKYELMKHESISSYRSKHRQSSGGFLETVKSETTK